MPEKLSANEYSSREINLILVFSIAFLNDYMGSNHFTKVVHNHFCIYFLDNVLRLLTVKILQSKSVFQMAKRSPYSPAHMV